MNQQTDLPLSKLTTLGIGGPAKKVITVNTQGEFIQVLKEMHQHEEKFMVIGSGSNLLVTDQPLDLTVIHNQVQGIEQNGHDLVVQSGTILQNLVDLTIEQGLAGMQNMTGIPGTVGGAIYGSAGAYGNNIRDFLTEVKYFDGTQIKASSKQELETGYRDSIFKHNKNLTILEATFSGFEKDSPEKLKQEAEETLNKRLEKYPPGIKTPGSFFKNIPVEDLTEDQIDQIKRVFTEAGKDPEKLLRFGKVPAGPLLELVGANGTQQGQIKIAENHGNTFINLGDGSAADFCNLASLYIKKVKEKFGVKLEPEVQLVGLPEL